MGQVWNADWVSFAPLVTPRAVAAIKRGILLGEREGHQAALAYEDQIAKELMHGPDAQEGIQSFLENRKPDFGDR